MKRLLNEIKELAPYLAISFIVVLLSVVLLSKYLPTAKDIEPAAKVLLEMSGRL